MHLGVGGPASEDLARVLGPRGVSQGGTGGLAAVGHGLEREREKKKLCG